MEAEVISSFIPELVTAISDNVLSVSDQCLSKGLITESTHKKVLESGGTSEDRARTLTLAVKTSTETDSRCFELFLLILDLSLPHCLRGSLLTAMKQKLIENTKLMLNADDRRSIVPACGHLQFGERIIEPVDSKEIVKQQTSFFGKLEDAIRQHERACADKSMLEERLKSSDDEIEQLKKELGNLRSSTIDSTVNLSKIEAAQCRISICEEEMSKLTARLEELELIIEEQGMQVRRGRNTMSLGMMNLVGRLTMLDYEK